MYFASYWRSKRSGKTSNPGLLNPWPSGHIYLSKLFRVALRSFCAVDFLMERLTEHFLANEKDLNQNLHVLGFSEIGSDLRRRPFFCLVFTYFLGQIPLILTKISDDLRREDLFFLIFTYFLAQIPVILTKISDDLRRRPFFLFFTNFWGQTPKILAKGSTDFVQQTCDYLEFNLGKNACCPQKLFSRKCGPY